MPDLEMQPIELWTGKQVFSVLVRPNAQMPVFLNLAVREKNYTGHERNGFYSVLLRDYDAHTAASCMNRLAKFSARWIGNHGFSIGIDDIQPREILYEQMSSKIKDGYKKCNELILSSSAETLEQKIIKELEDIRSSVGNVCMKELHWRNSPLIMSQCGSKGSPLNISQMVACVGQQLVHGKRAPNGFIDRSLPHFPINSETPAAKGFVGSSFSTGLTPTVFFFHTMSGREGLIDSAVKIPETGYISRNLMKGLEDLAVYYDQTVRNASGGIVQFLYGDDGMDPAKMEGKDGVPLNFDQLFMNVMATCPLQNQAVLSPSEILKFTDERLSRFDMSPEGGFTCRFKDLLEDFVKERAKISGISAKQLKVFLETCISRYKLKKIEAGTAVGALGAQSIAEPGRQMTFKTFHFAGVASMYITVGVPRIKEIIYAKKNISTPMITAFLCNDKAELSAHMVKNSIEKTVLGEVVDSIKEVLEADQPYVDVKLDMKRIGSLYMNISAKTVKQSILKHPKMKLEAQHVRVICNDKLRIEVPELDRSRLRYELHNIKSVLPKVVVKGIPTIERAVIEKKKKNEDNKEIDVYHLMVEGTNLLAVMGTPGIDGSKTTSNHVMEVQRTLGIEAARKIIISEIMSTMHCYGMSIDIRHVMLLADCMTYKESTVLKLASIGKSAEHIFNAAYSGKEDPIEGVCECIIMGIPMQLGSGMLKIRQRLDSIPEFKYPDPLISGVI
ncbi:hypothetical protein LUZ61_007784 [Rhynchospora tenuis]|uniref:DNA-directed RNA polymerase n=1 Tax=Rhynchospora tenuis TaxID=198213 RepID=A0AAD6EWX1_9POAL|nr:hypothetical protein LUZ61_007784 [Rhynchospora tenuis]